MKPKKPPKPVPADDDSNYLRTCSRCYAVRYWVEPICLKCGNPEFMLPTTTVVKEGEDG